MVYTIVVHLYAKDSPDAIDKLHKKLIEASEVYSRDKETLSWFVMRDCEDRRSFTIVERYERESVSFPFVFGLSSRGVLLYFYFFCERRCCGRVGAKRVVFFFFFFVLRSFGLHYFAYFC